VPYHTANPPAPRSVQIPVRSVGALALEEAVPDPLKGKVVVAANARAGLLVRVVVDLIDPGIPRDLEDGIDDVRRSASLVEVGLDRAPVEIARTVADGEAGEEGGPRLEAGDEAGGEHAEELAVTLDEGLGEAATAEREGDVVDLPEVRVGLRALRRKVVEIQLDAGALFYRYI
jgi:hypothetical protein